MCGKPGLPAIVIAGAEPSVLLCTASMVNVVLVIFTLGNMAQRTEKLGFSNQ